MRTVSLWFAAGVLAAASFVATTGSAAAAPERPVIVVPGIVGSKLCAEPLTGDRSDLELLWGALFDLSALKDLRLGIPSAIRVIPCGILEEFAVIPGLFGVSIYRDLLDELENAGYVPGKTLYVFDYDWRRSNFDTAAAFAAFVAKVKAESGAQKVDVIAHSMGGIVTRIYLQENGGAAHVGRVVFMGTPHRGAAQIFQTADEGWGLIENLLAGGTKTIREAMFSWPSVYEVLPLDDCCIIADEAGNVRPLMLSDPANWARFSWFPDDLTRGDAAARLVENLKRSQKLGEILRRPLPAGVEPLYVGSENHETAARVLFDKDYEIEDILTGTSGDEAVTIDSATNDWSERQVLVNAVHTELFDDTRAIAEMRRFLGISDARTLQAERAYRSYAANVASRCDRGDFRLSRLATSKSKPKRSWAVLGSRGGAQACVNAVRLDVGPGVFAAGAPMPLRLTISGQPNVASYAAKPRVLVYAPGGPVRRLSPAATRVATAGGVATRTYTYKGTAPSTPGFYRLTVEAPGLPESASTKVIAVVAPRR